MASKSLFLVCNAHLDPVWLWEWEEGLAETLSTFRTASALCEEFDGFVFCHNESVLYQWIEEYDPELFSQIGRLIEGGRWHVMGGWFLQPDCNLPSGESFVRQILVGKRYFSEKFGVEPETAINLDPFGHSRGLVQILKKSGYHSYLFCRPDMDHLQLPADDFLWIGYDGSEVMAHRAPDHYNSRRGEAGSRVEEWTGKNRDRQKGLLLWGIGNHGGGPSREDLNQIGRLMNEEADWEIAHSRPEEYFEALLDEGGSLPRFEADLNPWAVGCYTSMALIKQKHRILENLYFSTEKMLAGAALQGLIDYPRVQLQAALEDMLFCEFHDILPGSSISEVEEYALQRMDHGLEILSRIRSRAFFAFLTGEPQAEEGEFPIFAYNPHPFDLDEILVCELQPPEPNLNPDILLVPEVRNESGEIVSVQVEKESSNIPNDQRKRVVFRGVLKASAMNRFSCRLREVKPVAGSTDRPDGDFRFSSDLCETVINRETGLIDSYRVDGFSYLEPGSFKLLVMNDYPDPWGMKVRAFRDVEGAFTLMSGKDCAEFSGVSLPELEPVRIIEDGPIRTTVEALFSYNRSQICIRYKIPRIGSEIEVEVRVYWLEKDRMLKLSIPTPFRKGGCRGQVAYGVEEFDREGEELVSQKWIGIGSEEKTHALTVINHATYGFDFHEGELRLSLLRSPAYSGHPVTGDVPIVPQDRFESRIDQGERIFRFWLNASPFEERFSKIDREALVRNEKPMILCCSPPGGGEKPMQSILLTDRVVQLAAAKMAEDLDWLVLRLFEPSGVTRDTGVIIPSLGLQFEVTLDRFQIRSFAVDLRSKAVFDVDLLERAL